MFYEFLSWLLLYILFIKKKKKHNVMNFSLANKIHSLYQIDHEIGMGLWEPCA